MGRRTKFSRGSEHNGFKIVETPKPSSDNNRMLGVVCSLCGTGQTVWASNLSAGKVNCPGCAETQPMQALVTNGKAPILAVYDNSVVIVMHGQLVPTDAKLYQFVDGRNALPYTPKAPGAAPKPSTAYKAYMEVPATFLDYYCPIEGRTVSSSVEDAAYDYYMDHVDAPEGKLGGHTAAGRDTWERDGQLWAYLYWTTDETWPKSLLPRPAKATTAAPVKQVKRAEPVIPGLEEALETLKQLKEADDAAFEAKRQAEAQGLNTWDLEVKAIATSAAVQSQEEKIQRMRFPI